MKAKIMLIIFAISLLLYGCTSSTVDKTEVPDDFDFELKYGIGAKNVINTFTDEFTKDLVMDGTISTKLVLSNKDKELIYKEMMKIDIMNYPAVFNPPYQENPEPGFIVIVTPNNTYYFRIFMNGTEKVIHWNDTNNSSINKAKDLRNVIDIIENIIIAKKEYKKLPDTNGFYK